jgi:GMP synthase-like glutamine amidotransferase
MKTVFIISGNAQYVELFHNFGYTITDMLHEADLVCFTGGADVTPSLYGDAPHIKTHNDVYRDNEERIVFDICVQEKIPMVGICRGGQFLNVMSGGRMYQHVSGHTASHLITDLQTGDSVFASSTHHQMIMPSPEAVLVASSTIGGAREWYDQEIFKKDVSKEDIEVVYYKETNCLCFQPHPEFSGYPALQAYFHSLIERYSNV